MSVRSDVHAIAGETGFSGVITVSRPGARLVDAAYGYANRALRVRNTMQTRFALASGSKGLTALAVGCLLRDGDLGFEMTARAVLGDLRRCAAIDPMSGQESVQAARRLHGRLAGGEPAMGPTLLAGPLVGSTWDA